MKRKNATRRALFTSIMSLLLCVSMLVGTTFAWFTDSVVSGNNTIAAGNLDIEVTNADGDSIEDLETLFNDVKLWEPGAVAYEKLTISNEGSLALKYAMSFAWNHENDLNGHKLSDVLKVAVLEADVVAGLDMENREAVLAAAKAATSGDLKTFSINGSLYPVENTDAGEYTERAIHIVIYWEPGALDNLYNANNGQQTSDGEPLHIDLGVVVKATQQMKEEDSFGDDYDERAEYPENAWLGDATYDWYTPGQNEYTLTYASDLAGFANIVNGTAPSTLARSGYLPADSFEGKTVKLADSIDLNDLAWTPIGAAGTPFKGTFDGGNFTIYNLNVNVAKRAGLFGYVIGKLNNVKIEGASVRATDYAGALLGQGYAYIDNCHVLNADVIVTPAWDADKNVYDGGAKAGGLVGQNCEGGLKVTNSTAAKVNVRGYRDVGGLMGMAHNNNIVSGNAVENVTVSYIAAEGYAPYADGKLNENISVLAGRIGSSVKVENNTYSGAQLIHTVAELADALTNGGKFALAKDLSLDADNTLTVPEGVDVALDLNGCTIAGVTDDADKNDDGKLTSADNEVMIDVRGTLSVKNGTMTIKHESDNLEWNGCTEIFYVGFNGTLNVENAVIENLGGSDMAYAIDMVNAATSKGITVNIQNATIKSSYIPVRVFNNGSGMNNVTIENSTIEGVSRALWVHIYSSKDNGNKGTKDATLNLNIYGNGNKYLAKNPNRIIEFGFDDAINFTAEGSQIVSDAVSLGDVLASGQNVVLNEGLKDAPVQNTAPYGNAYGIAQNGGVLDGNGKTLDFDIGPRDSKGRFDNYGIMTAGGTIKNVTITGVFRGIMIMNPTADVYIDNVVIGDEDVCYAINTGEGDGTHSLYVTNSTIKGWSSYGTAIKSLSFTNCTFAQGEYYTDVFGRLVKPYVDAVFDSCEFNSKFYIDLSQLGKDGDGNVLNADTKIVLKNCTVNGVKLTAENWMDLIASEDDCGAGQISIEGKDGTYMTASNIFDYVVIE